MALYGLPYLKTFLWVLELLRFSEPQVAKGDYEEKMRELRRAKVRYEASEDLRGDLKRKGL